MQTEFDVAIAGGGLAGLSAAILLQRQGHRVVVLEKDAYPHHKVCGEYLSLECWDFLCRLGLPLAEWNLPRITHLRLTAPNGNRLDTALPLGGFGLSRHRLDSELARLATEAGVEVRQRTKVMGVSPVEGGYEISATGGDVRARVALAAHGKRSQLDVKWNREFLHHTNRRLNNYVGVKYHLRTDWPAHLIGLHNFRNGYCGVSKVEDDRYCLCYLTRAENLKANGGSLPAMEELVLAQNPWLRSLLQHSERLPGFPLAISQISFSAKSKAEEGVLQLGDAAGLITPLCGNGMSIALHTGSIAAELVNLHLQGRLSPTQLVYRYHQAWNQAFARRLQTGRALQAFFGSDALSNLLVGAFRLLPFLARPLIRLTHGRPF